MNIILKMTVLIATVAAMTACASPPPNGEFTKLRGLKPNVDDARALVMPYLKRSLKDFDSLKDFQFLSGPHTTVATQLSGNFEEAWMICVEYNAKNSYGGFTGIQTHTIPMVYSSTGDLTIDLQANWLHFGPQC